MTAIEALAELWRGRVTIDGPDGSVAWLVTLRPFDWLARGVQRFEGKTLAEAVELATGWVRGQQ